MSDSLSFTNKQSFDCADVELKVRLLEINSVNLAVFSGNATVCHVWRKREEALLSQVVASV